MKIKKRILSLALAGTMALGLMPGMTMTAFADEPTTSYTLTIPSTLTVANSGWNAIGNISATGTLESGKKLTVAATSANEWNLKKDDSNQVSYTLNNANGDAAGDAATSWEFTELSETAATKAIGIVVSDYSTKPAGTYQDTVTFTAKVESATSSPEIFNTNQRKNTYDGIHFTITCNQAGDNDGIDIGDGGYLTITAKNNETITKVEFHSGTIGPAYAHNTTVTAGTINWADNSHDGSIDNVNTTAVTMRNSAEDYVQIDQIKVYYE